MTEYLIPTGRAETELVEKRSRFIGQVWPVESEEEARGYIEAMKKKYYDARHNCWCYRIQEGGVERYSDDGEPQGTAGQPMLNVFQREEVTNVCCVVTRYFGGILLGAGGLVRAYAHGAKLAVDAAGKSIRRIWDVIYLPVPYSWYERMLQEIQRFGGVVRETQFGADVELEILTPHGQTDDFLARIFDLSAGTLEGMVAGQEYRAFPVEP